jgi:hypothetical protein
MYRVTLDYDGCLSQDNLFHGTYEQCKAWINPRFDRLPMPWVYGILSEATGRYVSYVLD